MSPIKKKKKAAEASGLEKFLLTVGPLALWGAAEYLWFPMRPLETLALILLLSLPLWLGIPFSRHSRMMKTLQRPRHGPFVVVCLILGGCQALVLAGNGLFDFSAPVTKQVPVLRLDYTDFPGLDLKPQMHPYAIVKNPAPSLLNIEPDNGLRLPISSELFEQNSPDFQAELVTTPGAFGIARLHAARVYNPRQGH